MAALIFYGFEKVAALQLQRQLLQQQINADQTNEPNQSNMRHAQCNLRRIPNPIAAFEMQQSNKIIEKAFVLGLIRERPSHLAQSKQ